MMILFALITSSFLVVLSAATVSPETRCGANHTRLLLLVDIRHDTNLTITRLKNIVSPFITKVKDSIIKTLDVCLVDPFQEKTLFNLTNVTSSREISSAIDQLIDPNINEHNYDSISEKISFEKAFTYSHNVLLDQVVKNTPNSADVVVFLSRCYESCSNSESPVLDFAQRYRDMSMVFVLVVPPRVNSKWYKMMLGNDENHRRSSRNDHHTFIFVNFKDDFTGYNPVSLDHCKDCPEGWTGYALTGHKLSCYFVVSSNTPISWIQASKRCASIQSILPVIESDEELTFVRNLWNNYNPDPNLNLMNSNLLNQTRSSAHVYLGLTKIVGSQNHHYVWSNLRPFSLDINFDKSDNYTNRCGALIFPLNSEIRNNGINWTLVNCYDSKSSLLMCEMEGGKIYNYTGVEAKSKSSLQSIPNGRDTELMYWYGTEFNSKKEQKWSLFDCRAKEEMVVYNSVCDGLPDCVNGRDEMYCTTPIIKANDDTFFCVNPNGVGKFPTTVSVPFSARCNFIHDCPDKSDELGCNGCLEGQCEDGTCVPRHWLSHDHEVCPIFIGANRIAYLNVSYPCQGRCSGLIQLQHEISFCDRNIKLEQYSEGQTFYMNNTNGPAWSPKCLYLRGKGGIPSGCDDQYQLRDCSTFQCPKGFFKCLDSYCVPVYNFKDEVMDCPHGEDEDLSIFLFVKTDEVFKCPASGTYIHQVHICDGVPHCPYREDEAGCNIKCPQGFKCYSKAVGVNNFTLPEGTTTLDMLDIQTKFLNLSDVDLSRLKEPFFFPNLLEIHVSNCNLVDLDGIFVSGITNRYLYTADFSYNKFTALYDDGPLSYLINVQFLSFSNNQNLSHIGDFSIFSYKLHTLDLSYTGISYLRLYIFQIFNTLKSLNLRNTKITHVHPFKERIRFEFLNLEQTSLNTERMTNLIKSVSVISALYVDDYKYCCPQISGGGTPKHACHAPRDAISSCEDLLSDLLKRLLLWLVAGVSLVGNIIVITYRLFYDRYVFKKGYGVFVTHLSVSDFVMGVYLLIIASTDVRYRDVYVLHESVWRHSALCQAAGFLSTLSSQTSTFFVFLITMDRYLVIRFPFGNHRFTKLGLILSILSAWILGFILASVPLMHPHWIIYSSNGMCLGLPLGSGRNLGWHYSFAVFICVNFILFICIACGQMLIFRSISSSHSFQKTNVQSVVRRLQDIDIAKQLFLVALSNFLCWFSICVLGFLSLTGHEVNLDTYAWLVVFVMPLNAAVNPMIYTIPAIYNKWQDFKTGQNNRTGSRVNKSETLEARL